MAEIPIILKLKKQAQRDVALAQDILVKELFSVFDDAVMHGGTAIWRCYNGNRFSEDVDVYIHKDLAKIQEFFNSLESVGFKMIKKRIKENSIYSELLLNNTPTRFEATFQNKKLFFKKYETSESFFIGVYALSPEDLIMEKVETYLKRKKIRDLYDIYFLLDYTENKKLIESHLKKLITHYEKPKDEENLANILIVGLVPNSNQLLAEIKKWVK